MKLGEALLPEFDYEMAGTRKLIERIPERALAWKPHEKSMSMIGLATHLADLLTWGSMTIDQESYDMAPAGSGPRRVEAAVSVKEALARFDANVAKARAAIANATNERLLSPWSLYAGGVKLVTMPRTAVLRRFVLSHLIHHRAQLGVYLRINDVPLPSIYGPTADESR